MNGIFKNFYSILWNTFPVNVSLAWTYLYGASYKTVLDGCLFNSVDGSLTRNLIFNFNLYELTSVLWLHQAVYTVNPLLKLLQN